MSDQYRYVDERGFLRYDQAAENADKAIKGLAIGGALGLLLAGAAVIFGGEKTKKTERKRRKG